MSFILTVKERSSEHEIINNILFAYVIIVIVTTNKAHVENSTDIEIHVALYVRISTEHQRYSTENQQLVIAD